MKLAVYLADQNPHRDRTLGVTQMTEALLQELLKDGSIQMEAVVSASSFCPKNSRLHSKKIPWRTDRMIGRLLADNFHTWLRRLDADVWLYPKGYLPFFLRPSAPCVGIVHDTILLWYFDHYRRERSVVDYVYWLNLMKRSIARFDLILTISQSAKTQILELCERFSIKPPQIEVTYESVRYASEKTNCSKEDYVVHVASKLPHKKTAWLLECWVRAIQSDRDLPQLKLIGSLPDSIVPLVATLSRVEKMPFLDDETYKQTLAKARALIMPSEIEGFGLPAVEAYCLGTPVCYVKGTAVDEILAVPGRTGSFELADPDSLFLALDEVLALSEDEVALTRARMQDNYSGEQFGRRVRACLSRV